MGLLRLSKKERDIWDSIEIGNEVEIILKNVGKEKYITTVLDITNTSIHVKTPMVGNAFIDLPHKMPVAVKLEVRNPQRGKISFNSRVIAQEWLKENSIKIACPRKLWWVQLRWHPRIEAELSAKFSFVEEGETDLDLHVAQPVYSAIVKNLSEGGALLVVDRLLSVGIGSSMNMKVYLPSEVSIRARSKVVHMEFIHGKCGLGIKWVTVEGREALALKDFIFANIKK